MKLFKKCSLVFAGAVICSLFTYVSSFCVSVNLQRQKVIEIIDAKIRIIITNPRNQTDNEILACFEDVIVYGTTEQLRTLLSIPGLNLNAPYREEGHTVLHYAVAFERINFCGVEGVRLLLEHGADPTIENNVNRSESGNGETPLDLARRFGFLEIINLF